MHNWLKIKQHPELLHTFLVREKVIDTLRVFFKSRNFHEVETPLLVRSPGTEPYLEVFETELKFAEGDNYPAFLLTSPEYAMKKLLAAGLGNIFQICKSFRNKEGRSDFHNPEFTILEYYRIHADYTQLMQDMEDILLTLLKEVKNNQTGYQFTYQGKLLDLTPPFERLSVAEAFEKYAQISVEQLLSEFELPNIAAQKGYMQVNESNWEQAYNQIFLNEIEPQLNHNKPVILYDYPASQAALSRKKINDPRFAERFELYLAGIELGNAFSELTDAVEQKSRLQAELEQRQNSSRVMFELDTDFIEALESGIPQSAGIAIGIDRLVMLFADAPSIKDTLFFPVADMFSPAQS